MRDGSLQLGLEISGLVITEIRKSVIHADILFKWRNKLKCYQLRTVIKKIGNEI